MPPAPPFSSAAIQLVSILMRALYNFFYARLVLVLYVLKTGEMFCAKNEIKLERDGKL